MSDSLIYFVFEKKNIILVNKMRIYCYVILSVFYLIGASGLIFNYGSDNVSSEKMLKDIGVYYYSP